MARILLGPQLLERGCNARLDDPVKDIHKIFDAVFALAHAKHCTGRAPSGKHRVYLARRPWKSALLRCGGW